MVQYIRVCLQNEKPPTKRKCVDEMQTQLRHTLTQNLSMYRKAVTRNKFRLHQPTSFYTTVPALVQMWKRRMSIQIDIYP